MATQKSVLQDLNEKRCWLCGCTGKLHLHHTIGGSSRRKVSDKYGFVVWLCPYHHTLGPDSVHNDPQGLPNRLLKEMSQDYYEANIGTREQFIKEFGKSFK